jgi:hypothetical protein
MDQLHSSPISQLLARCYVWSEIFVKIIQAILLAGGTSPVIKYVAEGDADDAWYVASY